MAGENKMPTREECLACVKANRGEAAKKIAKLAEACKKEREECLLAQQNFEAIEAANPELQNESREVE